MRHEKWLISTKSMRNTCEVSLSGTVCLYKRQRRTQFMIKLPVFKEKKCSYLYNNFVCWGCDASQTPQLYLEET